MSGLEAAEAREIIREELKAVLSEQIEDIRLIKDNLNSILELQKHKLDELDVLYVGCNQELKINMESFTNGFKGFIARNENVCSDIKKIYYDVRDESHTLRQFAQTHDEKISSHYHHFLLKVFGISAIGGLFALVLYQLFFRFIYPFITRLL